MQKHFLVLLGTRPEAIKLFPVINRLKGQRCIAITVCATAQHRHLLDQVLRLTKVVPDLDLNLMTTNQTLDHLTARLLGHVGEVLGRVRPTRVIVQGHSDSHGRRIGVVLSSHSGLPPGGGPAERGHLSSVAVWAHSHSLIAAIPRTNTRTSICRLII